MIRAQPEDKELIINILVNSFKDNRSINYIIKKDCDSVKRIKRLMEYSFDVCNLYGNIFLTADKKGCALLILPDKKKLTIKSFLLDIKFVFTTLQLVNIKKTMRREAKIKQLHPKGLLYYLWFIGVDSHYQNNGIGSQLLQDIMDEARNQNRTIVLETSTEMNLNWYKKFGFIIYHELDFGYKLYCLKNA